MKWLALIIGILLMAGVSNAELYTVEQPDGTVLLTDKPTQAAEKVREQAGKNEAEFQTQVAQYVPDWQRLNTDTAFIKWLDYQKAPFSSKNMHQTLWDAWLARDLETVVEIFNAYKQTVGEQEGGASVPAANFKYSGETVQRPTQKPRAKTLSDFRKEYPMYNDMSDEEVLTKLHRDFYSDMTYKDFVAKFNPKPPIRIFEVTDPATGRVLEFEGDTPPTTDVIERAFARVKKTTVDPSTWEQKAIIAFGIIIAFTFFSISVMLISRWTKINILTLGSFLLFILFAKIIAVGFLDLLGSNSNFAQYAGFYIGALSITFLLIRIVNWLFRKTKVIDWQAILFSCLIVGFFSLSLASVIFGLFMASIIYIPCIIFWLTIDLIRLNSRVSSKVITDSMEIGNEGGT